ncbi:hypothetical protein EH223_01035 [candidate division KSB1 bacterium]|nr:hypothetical protein [candidate division KSB1 bacterium]RQW06981.1 MAG: hypothetical protein EH223_01035 [candidate division KSB1 bacterium]
MLYIFKKVSNQGGIRATKNHIKAHLLAIRLYKHDALLSMLAIGQIFVENSRYLLYALKPMLVMIIPVMIIIIQLGTRYGYNPAQVDQAILISIHVKNDVDLKRVTIVPSSGIRIDVPPLYIVSTHEIFWRICPLAPGTSTVTFHYNEQSESKKIVAGHNKDFVSAKRVRSSFAAFFYPAEKRLPSDSFLNEITVGYPENRIQLAGFSMHWLLFFLLVSVGIGFLTKGIFRVQI